MKDTNTNDKLVLIEKAIEELESLYAPNTELYLIKRELIQKYRNEWYKLKSETK
jgi:hypothetical protein